MLDIRNDLLTKVIDKRKKGIQTITTPIINVPLSNEKESFNLEVAGFEAYAVYNKPRESQAKQDSLDNRFRKLRKDQKMFASRNNYDEFPSSSYDLRLDLCRRFKNE